MRAKKATRGQDDAKFEACVSARARFGSVFLHVYADSTVQGYVSMKGVHDEAFRVFMSRSLYHQARCNDHGSEMLMVTQKMQVHPSVDRTPHHRRTAANLPIGSPQIPTSFPDAHHQSLLVPA